MPIALPALADRHECRALLRSRTALRDTLILGEVGQRLNRHLKNVFLIVEFGPQTPSAPPGSNPIQERLLLRFVLHALTQNENGPTEAPRLIELILRRRRVVRSDDQ